MAETEMSAAQARTGKGGARALPGREKALGLYERMVLIRKYEERIYFLFLEGAMPGSIHQSHGQEACAVGMLYDLSAQDYMVSTHRPAGHDLAKGVSLQGMMSEMFAKANGCCHGKGGAMHTGDIAVGVPPANAIVGGNIPIAAGIGLAFKLQRKKNVCVAFFGDGASNEGAFHEGVNAAAVWDLPVILVCENNLYGASTPYSRTSKVKDVAIRAAGYGMPGEIVDGQDVLAVNEAATRAIERARSGGGPTPAGAQDLPDRRALAERPSRLPDPGGGGGLGGAGSDPAPSGRCCRRRGWPTRRRWTPSTPRWSRRWTSR